MSGPFQPQTGEHAAQSGEAPSVPAIDSIYPQTWRTDMGRSGVIPPPAVMAPTRSSFLAHWIIGTGATGYRLDVSTNGSFHSYVNGYQDRDVGNVTSRIVIGLSPGTTYYYRVRAYDPLGPRSASNIMTATTATASGLVINPTFDSSILSHPQSAAIQSAINQAIALYQSLFRDQITVNILFRYSNTQPNGTPMGTALGRSFFVVYMIPWNTYINALRADAKTGNDATANASLPGSSLSTNIVPSSAGGRVVGLDTPPAMFSNGTVGAGGPYDGIVTLNSNQPFQFSRPPGGSNFDAQRSTEHEINEVLGLGSHLGVTPPSSDLRPQDLFSWAAPGSRNTTSTGVRYFSINSGSSNIVSFNQSAPGDFGDWFSASCPQANPYVQNAFSCTAQFSDVTASSPEGVNLDVIGYDLGSPSPTPTKLLNLSTRLRVQTGENVLIGGFIITGTAPKHVLLRAIGPSLTQLGVPNALPDPVLELHGSGGFVTITNDNWMDDPAQKAAILATGIPPSNDLESAIDVTLSPGAYTAIVSGKNGTTGIGLVEVYDFSQGASSQLANISTRGFVETGDNVMIAGFILGGNTGSIRVAIRGIGPSLTRLGFSNVLADPTLELHNSNGTTLVSNDNWQDDAAAAAALAANGLALQDSLESGIFTTLPAGSYTAILAGKNNGIGVGLVEVYNLQ